MAPAGYSIVWHVEPPFAGQVRKRALAALARRALAAESAPVPLELSIVISDDATVRELNRRYRGIDESTDVLSFEMGEDADFVTPEKDADLLGEVVISYPTAARQAEEAGHSAHDEVSHLLVHGILHLLGYDHASAAAARVMREREDELLGGTAH